MLASAAQAWQVRQANFPPEIGFDTPRRTLAVSVTGTACALDCAHCGRHYLQHMVSLPQVARQYPAAIEGLAPAAGGQPLDDGSPAARLQQSTSLLISGGCDAQGRVPVTACLDALRRLRPGRRLNWHVGLIDEADLAAIRPLVDVVSFDFVGDDETIRQVYGLKRTVADYVACYQQLRAAVPVVPHLTIGLRGGDIHGERQALRLLGELGASALVFLVFIPTPGTRYSRRRPPAVEDVAAILTEARLLFPTTPLILGCMRPGGSYRSHLDTLAVHCGINRLVNPALAARRTAKELGLRVVASEECCVF